MSVTSMSGKRELGPTLLALGANGGCRYVIARMVHTREAWLMVGEPGGPMGGSPVVTQVTGASSEPWDTWVAAGRLPEGARKVEIDTGETIVPGKVRGSLWLAGVPWHNRDMEFEVRFLSRDGTVVSRAQEQLIRTRPRPRAARATKGHS